MSEASHSPAKPAPAAAPGRTAPKRGHSQDLGGLDGTYVAVLADDRSRAEPLAAALRRQGAVALVCPPSSPDWTWLRAFDPDVTLAEPGTHADVLGILQNDVRLRFSHVVRLPQDFSWPAPGGTCEPGLLEQITGAVGERRSSLRQLRSSPRVETSLRCHGPGHLLRALARSGRAHRVTLRTPDLVVAADLAGGLLWGVSAELDAPRRPDAFQVLRHLLRLTDAEVTIERTTRPRLGNLMLPVQAALAMAAVPEHRSGRISAPQPSREGTLHPQPIEPVAGGAPRPDAHTIHPRADELWAASPPPLEDAPDPTPTLYAEAPLAAAGELAEDSDAGAFMPVRLPPSLPSPSDDTGPGDLTAEQAGPDRSERVSLADALSLVAAPTPSYAAPAAWEDPYASDSLRPVRADDPDAPPTTDAQPSSIPPVPGVGVGYRNPRVLAMLALGAVALASLGYLAGGSDSASVRRPGDGAGHSLAGAGHAGAVDADDPDELAESRAEEGEANAEATTLVELALEDVEDMGSARQHFMAAVAHDPTHTEALRGLSEFDLAAGNAPGAVRWAKRLVAAKPREGVHHRILGDAYALQHRMPRARIAWARASGLGDRVAVERMKQHFDGDGDVDVDNHQAPRAHAKDSPGRQQAGTARKPPAAAHAAQRSPARAEAPGAKGVLLIRIAGGERAEAYHEGHLLGTAPGVFILPVGTQVVGLVGAGGRGRARIRAKVRSDSMARAKATLR